MENSRLLENETKREKKHKFWYEIKRNKENALLSYLQKVSDFHLFKRIHKKMSDDEVLLLYRKLGLTDAVVKVEQNRHLKDNERTKFCHVLRKWKKKNTDYKWKEILIKALDGLNRRDVIRELIPASILEQTSGEMENSINHLLIMDEDFHLFENLSKNISEDETLFLYRELGLADNEVEEEKKLHPRDNQQASFCHVLQKWKQMNINDSWKSILINALVSLNRQDLVNKMFPILDSPSEYSRIETEERPMSNVSLSNNELELFNRLSREISEDEAPFLFQELGLTNDEVEEETKKHPTDGQQLKTYYVLQNWMKIHASNNCNNWETVLNQALESLNRQDLLNKLFLIHPPKTKTSGSIVTSNNDCELFTYILHKMHKDEGLFLLHNLNGFTKENLEIATRVSSGDEWQKIICTLIEQWKPGAGGSWEDDLVQGLFLINRQDLIKDFFPKYCQTPTKFTTIASQKMPFSAEELTQILYLFNKIGKKDGFSLLNHLKPLRDDEMRTRSEINWLLKYCEMLEKWKQTSSCTDWKFQLAQALVAIKRQDVIADFFPEDNQHPFGNDETPTKDITDKSLISEDNK